MNLDLINSLTNVFNYKETEVPLITRKGIKVKVTSLLVKDELEMISFLSLSGYSREENFLRMLFQKIDYDSRDKLWNNDFETFLRSVGEPDVNSLAMGIVIATHEDEFQFSWRCTHCETENRNVINPMNVAQTIYPDCQNLFECTSKTVDILSDSLLRIKASYPNYKRLLNVTKYVEENYKKAPVEVRNGVELFLKDFIVPIESVTIYDHDGNEKTTLRTDNYDELETLITISAGFTNKVKRQIKLNIKDITEKRYGTILKFKTVCSNSNCRKETNHELSPIDLFLLMILD